MKKKEKDRDKLRKIETERKACWYRRENFSIGNLRKFFFPLFFSFFYDPFFFFSLASQNKVKLVKGMRKNDNERRKTISSQCEKVSLRMRKVS